VSVQTKKGSSEKDTVLNTLSVREGNLLEKSVPGQEEIEQHLFNLAELLAMWGAPKPLLMVDVVGSFVDDGDDRGFLGGVDDPSLIQAPAPASIQAANFLDDFGTYGPAEHCREVRGFLK